MNPVIAREPKRPWQSRCYRRSLQLLRPSMGSTRWAALCAFKITPSDFVVRDDSNLKQIAASLRLLAMTGWMRCRLSPPTADLKQCTELLRNHPKFNAISRKLFNPASMFSIISSTRSSGSGRLTRSASDLSFSQKISRLVLSLAMISL